MQLLPDECQQYIAGGFIDIFRIFNILFCMSNPISHDMVIRSFINSYGVAGDNRKPEELVDDYLSKVFLVTIVYFSCCGTMC